MGALRRATFAEIEECAKDPQWWPNELARVRDDGGLRGSVADRAWSYGAFIGWIRADDGRSAEYDEALRDYAHKGVMETLQIADGSSPENIPVDKERIKARQWVAGKWDRNRYGEKVDHIGIVLDPLSEMLREISERRIRLMRAPEKVVEVLPVEEI
jgi:hypothetical protein